MKRGSVHYIAVRGRSMKISLLLVLVSWLTIDAVKGVEHVFPANAETTYKWTTEVSTGVTLPGSHDNHASYFAFNANLRVRTDDTNKVFFKIENMNHTAYNGPVKKDKSPMEEHIFVEQCKNCGTAFAAVYEKGQSAGPAICVYWDSIYVNSDVINPQRHNWTWNCGWSGDGARVTSIELNESDELYVRNTKRAIVSQFQLDLEHILSARTFTSYEFGVNDLCQLKQSVRLDQDKNYVSLRKFFNTNDCIYKPQRQENLSFKKCSQSTTNPMSHTTDRIYKLNKKDELFVMTIKSRSNIITQPQRHETEAYFHVTTQNLDITSSALAQNDEWEIGKTISTSLTFEFPEENLETGEDLDMTFGRVVFEPEMAVNETIEILKKLEERLTSDDTDNKTPEQLHAMDMKRDIATDFLRRMTTDTLMTLVETIIHTEDKTLRNLGLRLLPRIGTLAAARVIMKLRHQVKEFEFQRMIVELPFHLRHLSLNLLEVCKDLLSSGSAPELLAYSAIVGEVCEETNICPNVSSYVKDFFTKMQESEDYGSKLLYLQALSNIRVDSVAEYLEPMIRDKVNHPHTLRYAAVWAAHHFQAINPDKAYELYWPILEDETEHHDMRHAAINVLLLSSPTRERFLDLLSYINSIDNPDMYNMLYTTVKSLIDTKHPCLQKLPLSVDEIYLLMPDHKVPIYASFNTITDYEDPRNGNGMIFQTIMVSDVKTGYPNILYFDAVSHYNGLVGNAMSLHVRLSRNAVRDMIGSANSWIHRINEFSILRLLQSLDGVTDTVTNHIEIIIKLNGRTVISEYRDSLERDDILDLYMKWKFFGTWVEEVKPITTLYESEEVEPTPFYEMPINLQTLDQSTAFETVLANDVGLPVTLFMKRSSLLSLSGSGLLGTDLESLYYHLNLRYLKQQSHGIYSLNPAIGLWQGVSRSRSVDWHLHLENNCSAAMIPFSRLLVSIDWEDGYAPLTAISHVNTLTYLKGAGAEFGSLDIMCPKCEVYHVVSSGIYQNTSEIQMMGRVSEFQFKYEVFSCEHPEELKYKEQLYTAFTSIVNRTSSLYAWHKPFLGLMEIYYLEGRSPSTGTCGQSVRFMSIGKARKLEVVVWENKNKRFNLWVDIHYKDAEGTLFKSWNGNIEGNSTSTDLWYYDAYRLQLRNKVEVNLYDVICIGGYLNSSRNRPIPFEDFNVLYEEPLISYKKLGIEINVGQNQDGECPQITGSQIIVSSTLLTNIPSSDLSAKCEYDRGHNRLYPATESCVKAAKHFKNARNVTINIKTHNLNTEVSNVSKLLLALLHLIMPETVPEHFPSEFNVDVAFDGEEKFSAWASEAENPGNWHDVKLSNFILGNSIAPLYSFKTCYAAGDQVYTYDGTSIKYNSVPKWTLLTGHCVDQPVFAVFTRKIKKSDMLAARFHLLTDVIEITPFESSLTNRNIKLNGKSFNKRTVPDYLKIELKNNVVAMTHEVISGVHVRVSNKYVTVRLTYNVAGLSCGLCGDYNQWPETSSKFPGPNGKLVHLENVTRVYTLP